ncbi:GspH/FimT family pseudopilin [Motilimonas sp. 1_MG-2023]|uniref:GspH/FimT family pseudopilin n=1 Tax=Motilimonas sp. 1_MG-2023 TaxID=3062672 RepID=UPI0026E3290C|nr:GspH/FimT family pseudopilin [Motilimonas sp. 1_MG-2023]MDO6526446.1 GspH/FimT family pseudopilin [Motilimonas sp. 1_MG-2023]
MISKPVKFQGFTLMELLIAIAVLSILLSIGVGSYSSLFKRNELRGASESLYSLLTYAKSESIKSNSKIAVSFTDGDNGEWCAGMTSVTATKTSCDCSLTDSSLGTACAITSGVPANNRLVVIDGDEFKKISLSGGSTIIFDNVRGFPDSTSSMALRTDTNDKVQVKVNVMGNVSTCTLAGSSDYSACS